MTDLIPRDAARNEVARLGKEFLDGGSPTAANVLNLAMDRINAIPTIDPAAIREAALEACTIIDAAVKEGHENPLDLIMHLLSAGEPARRALALIGEKK